MDQHDDRMRAPAGGQVEVGHLRAIRTVAMGFAAFEEVEQQARGRPLAGC